MATTGHTVKAFDEELDQLRATDLRDGRPRRSGDPRIDAGAGPPRRRSRRSRWSSATRRSTQLEAEVERRAVQIIALRAPMADDLREVIAALKIAGVVERIGDYAKNIAKRVGQPRGASKIEPLTLLPDDGADRRRDGPRRARRLRRARSR